MLQEPSRAVLLGDPETVLLLHHIGPSYPVPMVSTLRLTVARDEVLLVFWYKVGKHFSQGDN